MNSGNVYKLSLDSSRHSFDIDIFELSKLIGRDDNKNEALVKYFQEHGLLRKHLSYVLCGRLYSQVKKKGSVTG